MSFVNTVMRLLGGMANTVQAPAADDPLLWGPMQGPDPREVAWANSVRAQRAAEAQENGAYEAQLRAIYGPGLAPEAGGRPAAARALPGAAEMYGHGAAPRRGR